MSEVAIEDLQLEGEGSLQEQLYRALQQRIVSGRLASGVRLPASRYLAASLGVSRNTVSVALDQLKAEGYLDSRVGSGVFVSEQLPRRLEATSEVVTVSERQLSHLSDYGSVLSQVPVEPGIKDMPFAPGVPDLKAFPMAVWSRVMRRHIDRMALQSYDTDLGYEPLRQALSDYLRSSRGVRCDADQIVITQGAQQALSLCAQVLLNPGDEVLLEDPGYRGARTAFEAGQCQLHPVQVTENGINLEQLPVQTDARLLYLTPTHHYPLGGILPVSERLRLLEWAQRTETWILEDDYDSEFHFHGKPIAAMQGMAKQTPVIYMGSFSKTLFPALRLGYLVVPKNLAPVFAQAKNAMSGESPQLTQATVAEFIEEGHFVRHLRKMRKLYLEKWQHCLMLIDQHCDSRVQVVAQSAGMHLVVKIDGIDDVELERRFSEQGFGCTPLSNYCLTNQWQGLVLGFSNTTEQQREEGIKKLANIIAAMP